MALGGQPVGIQEVDASSRTLPNGQHRDVNKVELKRVLPASIAETETKMLEGVIQYGTGRAASIGQFAAGKTGTTSNFGDAWFVGWDSKYTVAVWVGYPDRLVPMTTDFNGQPVMGGTFPALIWHDFISSALQIDKTRAEEAAAQRAASGNGASGEPSNEAEQSTGTTTTGASGSGSRKGSQPSTGAGKAPVKGTAGGEQPAGAGGEKQPAPAAPSHEAPAQTPPTPAAPKSGAGSEPSVPPPSPTGGVGPGG
jgi:penicillin-binding protein 1A